MSTVRLLSARVTLFSSRFTWKTDFSEMGSLPFSSCPRTGTRRGPKTGSSYLMSFTWDKSGGGQKYKEGIDDEKCTLRGKDGHEELLSVSKQEKSG